MLQNGDTLKLRLIHKDAANIPRNHIRQDDLASPTSESKLFTISALLTILCPLRYVCWSAYILKSHHKLKSALGLGLEASF